MRFPFTGRAFALALSVGSGLRRILRAIRFSGVPHQLYLCCHRGGLIYGINDATAGTMIFYKIVPQGAITTLSLEPTCCGYYGGFFASGGVTFRCFPADVPGTRLLLELDEELNVLREVTWEGVAPGSGRHEYIPADHRKRTSTRAPAGFSGDTLYAVVPYLLPQLGGLLTQ